MLVRFFLEHSDVVGMASFQLQAATGRGEWRERAAHVTSEAIRERIREGVGLPRLAWDTALVGHPSCNRGTMLATVGGRAIDVLSDPPLYERFLQEFRHVAFDRRHVLRTARSVVLSAFRHPYWLARGQRLPRAPALVGPAGALEARAHRQDHVLRPRLHGRRGPGSGADSQLRLHDHDVRGTGLHVRAQRPPRRLHPPARGARAPRRCHVRSGDRRHPEERSDEPATRGRLTGIWRAVHRRQTPDSRQRWPKASGNHADRQVGGNDPGLVSEQGDRPAADLLRSGASTTRL